MNPLPPTLEWRSIGSWASSENGGNNFFKHGTVFQNKIILNINCSE
jgi:hypothetical protein